MQMALILIVLSDHWEGVSQRMYFINRKGNVLAATEWMEKLNQLTLKLISCLMLLLPDQKDWAAAELPVAIIHYQSKQHGNSLIVCSILWTTYRICNRWHKWLIIRNPMWHGIKERVGLCLPRNFLLLGTNKYKCHPVVVPFVSRFR